MPKVLFITPCTVHIASIRSKLDILNFTAAPEGSVLTERKTLDRRILAAYHEAGHAVLAHDQGIRVHGISIVPDEGRTGHVRIDTLLLNRLAPTFRFDKRARNRFAMERHVMVLLGGYAAVERLRPGDVHSLGMHGEGSDHSTAMGLLRFFVTGDEEAEKYYEWLKARTAGIVIRPLRWYQIQRLAKSLLEEEKLGARRVREIIRDAAREWTGSLGEGPHFSL